MFRIGLRTCEGLEFRWDAPIGLNKLLASTCTGKELQGNKDEALQKLGKLALEGLQKKKLIFEKVDCFFSLQCFSI